MKTKYDNGKENIDECPFQSDKHHDYYPIAKWLWGENSIQNWGIDQSSLILK